MSIKENENKTAWQIEIGLYPGILLGFRTYEMEDSQVHVLYLPFVDFAFTYFR
jgi:hypothetical protein